jgi:diguanylate cyclase (GGDEF)-like protein
VIRELEGISQQVRRNLATHHSNIVCFKKRVDELRRKSDGEPWQELSAEAERMLKPTLRLSTQIAHAYDEIRQQTNQLMTFTEVRTDPLTGLRNRRALDEGLVTHFALASRYGSTLSIAIFDIDHFKAINDNQGHLQGDHVLKQVARLIEDSVRDTDLAARFGGEEFVVLMPETDLIGAGILAQRVRILIEDQLPVTVSAGLAHIGKKDNPRSLFSRADAALYGAKSAGRNCVFRHTGEEVESVEEELPDVQRRGISLTANEAADDRAAEVGEPVGQQVVGSAPFATNGVD